MGSLCTWENRASLICLAKFSPACAVQARVTYMDRPDSTATAAIASARIQRRSFRYGYRLLPSTWSMPKRKICGVSAFSAVITKDDATAQAKYRLEP